MLIVGIVLCLLGLVQVVMGSNIDPTDKCAWSTNAGWINFAPTHGGVTVYAGHLEGYAWGENAGWIRMGSHTGGGSHHYDNTTNTNYGVNVDGSGNLSSYAWCTNVGWINFYPTHGGVTIDLTTGSLDGYAWGENIGWIHFKHTTVPTYNVAANLANLVVTKSVRPTRPVNPGDTITYTLVFSNAGPGTAFGVVFTDTILVSVINTSVISSGVTITQVGGTCYVWQVQDLAPGQGGFITITGQLPGTLTSSTFTNSATIATTAVDSDAGNNSNAAEVTVTGGRDFHFYLPLVFNNYIVTPDLVVQSVTATTDSVQVVIENQGDAPVTGEFWVQAYIDPDPAPSGVNQLWYDLSDAGMLWGVTSDLLPLSK